MRLIKLKIPHKLPGNTAKMPIKTIGKYTQRKLILLFSKCMIYVSLGRFIVNIALIHPGAAAVVVSSGGAPGIYAPPCRRRANKTDMKACNCHDQKQTCLKHESRKK